MGYSIHLTGASGRGYQFDLQKVGSPIDDGEGVYVFFADEEKATPTPLYVGQTESFKRRLQDDFDQHQQVDCLHKHGATLVGLLRVGGGLETRSQIETDLRQKLRPTCNQQ